MSGNRPLHFGVQTAQEGTTYAAIRDHWQLAERLGYDSVWVDDHLHSVGQPVESDQLECWTTLAALARETSRIRFGPLVSCHSYRPPAITAKVAATVDVLSNGRLEFGYGYGWHAGEYEAYGYPYPPDRVRSAQFGEALEICRRLWAEECVTFIGEHYRIEEAYCAPKPVQNPLPIWIGGSGSKLTLPWVARYANAWNAPGTPDEMADKITKINRACEAIDRDPGEILKTWFGHVLIDTDEARLHKRIEQRRDYFADEQDFARRVIAGTPEQVIEQVEEYRRAGVGGFLMIFGQIENHTGTELFANEVMAHLR